MIYLEQYQIIKLDNNNFIYLININNYKDQLIGLVTKNNNIEINIVDSKSKENKVLIEILSNKFVNNIIEGV